MLIEGIDWRAPKRVWRPAMAADNALNIKQKIEKMLGLEERSK